MIQCYYGSTWKICGRTLLCAWKVVELEKLVCGIGRLTIAKVMAKKEIIISVLLYWFYFVEEIHVMLPTTESIR